MKEPYEYHFQINIMNFISCIGFLNNYRIYPTFSKQTLGKIYQHGYCLFLGSDGKLCHVEFGKYDVETLKDYESLLSNITESNIKIITNQSDANKINQEIKKNYTILSYNANNASITTNANNASMATNDNDSAAVYYSTTKPRSNMYYGFTNFAKR